MEEMKNWSKHLKEKYQEFMKKAKFILIEKTVLLSEDTKSRLIDLINYAMEETEIKTETTMCEHCDKIPFNWKEGL